MEAISKLRKRLIIVQGPTASGKTGLAISLAQHFKTEIISGDSRQFYKEISIGTAKPTSSELKTVKHHFIDSHSIHDEVNAAQYSREARILLDKLFETKDTVIVCGGSGMFIDAFVFGLDDIEINLEIRTELEKRLSEEGLQVLVSELLEKDEALSQTMDLKNPARVIRALEVILSSGKKYSEQRTGFKNDLDCEVIRFAIQWPREQLYNRINKRVDLMLQEGLMEEVKAVAAFRTIKSLNTVGYKELFDHFDGKLSESEAIEKIKQHSRNYAKRQETWLRRYSDLFYLNPFSEKTLLEQVIENINRF